VILDESEYAHHSVQLATQVQTTCPLIIIRSFKWSDDSCTWSQSSGAPAGLQCWLVCDNDELFLGSVMLFCFLQLQLLGGGGPVDVAIIIVHRSQTWSGAVLWPWLNNGDFPGCPSCCPHTTNSPWELLQLRTIWRWRRCLISGPHLLVEIACHTCLSGNTRGIVGMNCFSKFLFDWHFVFVVAFMLYC